MTESRVSLFRKVIVCLTLILAANITAAQTNFPTVTAYRDAILYEGPGDSYLTVAWLRAGIPAEVRERNSVGNWLYVVNDDIDLAGWVMTGYLNTNPEMLFSEIPVNATAADSDPAQIEQPSVAALYVPPLISPISAAMIDVYERGQALGNHDRIITKVGDSLSADSQYLTPMSYEEIVLGSYDYLADTIRYFGESAAGVSAAARIGLTSYVVFDPMWADPELCNSGENPLQCEYRRKQPSIAFIMFGSNDARHIDAGTFADNMRQIVEFSLARGIIPVLSTFSYSPDSEFWWQSVAMNQAIIDLAAEYEVPLINLWMAARPLDNYGLESDLTHMTHSGFAYLKYDTGHESWYGVSLRNLLSIRMLDELRLTLGMD